ncbi:DUF2512 family protein [Alicyclobacillus sp. ALC3]|uniref:DUF2512 family protein n=1 Tax=Alicyclobacillus sp. ALC3 TaxID=2796143 RepID=UPI00237867EB|nr:DUF2512 family protein [Alicyclobacillus sp. ALC3]WDL97779.1 DUF2512 family protein [Alicyclobacillus sp. ALC3]
MSEVVVSLTNFLLKLVTVVLVLWVAGQTNPHFYVNTWIAFSTAIAVSLIGVITDLTALPAMGNGRALALDFIINTLLIWGIPNLVHQASITFVASIICSVIIALVEYSTHIFMLRTERLMSRR